MTPDSGQGAPLVPPVDALAMEFTRRVVDGLPDIAHVYDRDWRWVHMNAPAREWLRSNGRDPDALFGRVVWEEFAGSRDRAVFENAIELVAAGTPAEFEVYDAQRDEFFSTRIIPVPGAIVSLTRNVTDRRRADETLEQTARRLALAVELTGIGTWSIDLLTGEGTHDERLGRMLGVALGDSRPVGVLWAGLVHPDDLPRVIAEFDRATVAGANGPTRYATTHRIVRPDGTERFMSVAAQVIRDATGRAVRVAGVARDITADRDAQEARARAAAELEDVLERMSDALYAYDREWRIVRLNRVARARLESSGVDPDRAIGQVLWDVVPNILGTRYETELRRVMNERVACRFEMRDTVSGGWVEIQAHPTANGIAAYTHDVTAQRRMLETQQFLSHVGEVVAGSLDHDATLDAVARLGLPLLADYCVVDLIDEDGTVRRVAAAHADPARAPFLDAIRRNVPTLDSGSFVATVLRTGLPVFGETTGDVVSSVSRAPAFLQAVEALAPTSHCCVPMIARKRTIGSLLLVRTRPTDRPAFTPQDVALAEEMARRAALALDNARLFRAEHVARERTERLQRVTSALAAVVTERDVGEILVTNLAEVLHPLVVTFFGVAHDGGGAHLRLTSVRGLTRAEERRLATIPLDGAAPIAEIVRTGDIVFLESHDAFSARYPQWSGAERVGSAGAWAGIGLRTSVGEPLGGIAFGFGGARTFTPDERRYVESIVFQAAQALERVRLHQAESRARRTAEEANRAKTEFLAVMSHELRTPLNAIAGYTELIDLGIHGPVTDDMRGAIANIQRSQRHLLALIDEVLTFARIDSVRQEFRLGQMPVDETVRGIEALVRPQLMERGLEYVHVPPPREVRVRADRDRVEQILLNLLANAVKFTERGGRITTSVETTPDQVLVRVADTGIGIAPDRLADIFEPFVQVDSTLTRTRSGAGLGLAIARKLAHGMGGELTVESVVGMGTTFTLSLARNGDTEDGRRDEAAAERG